MRIVISDHLGHAPQVQLSRALASRGHGVLHLYSAAVQTPKADLHRRPDDASGLTIVGLDQRLSANTSFLRRRFDETLFGRKLARQASAFRPDIVVGCNNPLDIQRELQRACRRRGVPFVYWMQDFYAVQMDQALENCSAVLNVAGGAYYHSLESALLQRSDAVVAAAHDYLGILASSWDVFDRQCMVVPNWASLESVRPADKDNSWSRVHGLAEQKVVLYAGGLSEMENPMLLVSLAEQLRARTDTKVVVVSEGDGAALVERESKARGLSNLLVLPFQPYDAYADLLATGDVLIGSVSPEIGVLFVPSKVISYLCARRPIVLAAPSQNLAAQLIRDSGAGRVVPADDAAAMTMAVQSYLDDSQLWHAAAEQGRRYAEQSFEIERIADRFERLFVRLCTGPRRQRQRQIAAPVLGDGSNGS
jgi:colanic acid biosynthesis glycosyl transferase WcaI